MKIMLLSAGKGTRMLPLTQNTPKCLLHVGNGLTVLESQLEIIKRTKIKDIIIVVGYLTEQIESKIKHYRNELNITLLYNPFYDLSNNLISMWFAKHYMDDDFIVINGDDIFTVEVLEKLLAAKNDMTMVIDQKKAYDDDDMKLSIQEEKIMKISKEIPKDQIAGESVGIVQFKNGGNIRIKEKLEQMVRDKNNLNVFYLSAIQELIDEGYPVHYVVVSEEEWAEIDFHPDLKLIERNITKFHKNILKMD